MSYFSVDSADPRLKKENEKSKPNDGQTVELTKPSFGFNEDQSGNPSVDKVDKSNLPRDKGPPQDMGAPRGHGPLRNNGPPRNNGPSRDNGPPRNNGLPKNHGPPRDKSLPRYQGLSKDKGASKPTPKAIKAAPAPPPAALRPHHHKEKGCEFCGTNEIANLKLTSNDLARKFK